MTYLPKTVSTLFPGIYKFRQSRSRIIIEAEKCLANYFAFSLSFAGNVATPSFKPNSGALNWPRYASQPDIW